MKNEKKYKKLKKGILEFCTKEYTYLYFMSVHALPVKDRKPKSTEV